MPLVWKDSGVPLTALDVPGGYAERPVLTSADRLAPSGHLLAGRLDLTQDVFRFQHHLPFASSTSGGLTKNEVMKRSSDRHCDPYVLRTFLLSRPSRLNVLPKLVCSSGAILAVQDCRANRGEVQPSFTR